MIRKPLASGGLKEPTMPRLAKLQPFKTCLWIKCAMINFSYFIPCCELTVSEMWAQIFHWATFQIDFGTYNWNVARASMLQEPNSISKCSLFSIYYPFQKYAESERYFFCQFAVQVWCHLSPCLSDHSCSWVVNLLQLVFKQAGSKQNCRKWMS